MRQLKLFKLNSLLIIFISFFKPANTSSQCIYLNQVSQVGQIQSRSYQVSSAAGANARARLHAQQKRALQSVHEQVKGEQTTTTTATKLDSGLVREHTSTNVHQLQQKIEQKTSPNTQSNVHGHAKRAHAHDGLL